MRDEFIADHAGPPDIVATIHAAPEHADMSGLGLIRLASKKREIWIAQ
jgi:hypothetical protein